MKKPSKALIKKWYKKLEKSGFEDIEDVDSPNEYMKQWHSSYFAKRHTPDSFLAKRQYYEEARDKLNTFTFNNASDKKCWELHAEGWSMLQIANHFGINKSKVFIWIKRLKREFKEPN